MEQVAVMWHSARGHAGHIAGHVMQRAKAFCIRKSICHFSDSGLPQQFEQMPAVLAGMSAAHHHDRIGEDQ